MYFCVDGVGEALFVAIKVLRACRYSGGVLRGRGYICALQLTVLVGIVSRRLFRFIFFVPYFSPKYGASSASLFEKVG